MANFFTSFFTLNFESIWFRTLYLICILLNMIHQFWDTVIVFHHNRSESEMNSIMFCEIQWSSSIQIMYSSSLNCNPIRSFLIDAPFNMLIFNFGATIPARNFSLINIMLQLNCTQCYKIIWIVFNTHSQMRL